MEQPDTALLTGDIVLFGAGGHAKVVLDILERSGQGSRILLVDDDPAKSGTTVAGYRVLASPNRLAMASCTLFVAIGSNQVRLKKAAQLAELQRPFCTAIHPAAVVARTARIAWGTAVMAGVVVNSEAIVGEHCILNTGCSLDHDCLLEDGVHIGPGTVLCGSVRVGRGTLIGAGCTVLPNIRIGENVVVGAGTTLRKNVADNLVLCASPAIKVLQR